MLLLHTRTVPLQHTVCPDCLPLIKTVDYDLRFRESISCPYINHYRINSDTMLLATNKHRSLIISRNNGLQATPLSTRKLMRQYNRQQLIDFSQMRHIYHNFGHLRKLPQINGEYQFLPLSGTAHQNASWLALHYVKYYEQAGDHLRITFLNETNCELLYKGRQLEAEIHQCAAIGRILRTSLGICATNFGYTIELQSCFNSSIIHSYDYCCCQLCSMVPDNSQQLIRLLDDLEIHKSNYIYQAAIQEYKEYPIHEFSWYLQGVPGFIRKLRDL